MTAERPPTLDPPIDRAALRTVLVLGSGALKIGEAGEFDYSGSQAIKALKEEGIRTLLLNPNVATIQTSAELADEVFFLPVRADFAAKVIERERPDGILLSFGGQTALNCGLELEKRGVLERFGVRVLGTPIETIRLSEDREAFAGVLREIEIKTPNSRAVTSVAQALEAAKEIGYPIMARAAFALGGKGSGIAADAAALEELAVRALGTVPQLLCEEFLGGWKEVEYEVCRDAYDNCITVCNMENLDALGIHTGESIVVAPSQTLTDDDYQLLRQVSIRLIRHLGVVGECNVQFALHPETQDYRVIEVNARLSRSSALASKATGYPLAFVAAKLALGYALMDVPNAVTRVTGSCFEPALDYVVVKMPRWDLQKFRHVSREIGSEMKSVGEVMAIGRRFEEALQKACRMLGVGAHGVVANSLRLPDTEGELRRPTDRRVFVVAEALRRGMTVDEIHELTGITRWFLFRIRSIVEAAEAIRGRPLEEIEAPKLRHLKELGFSDYQIARLVRGGAAALGGGYPASRVVRARRLALGIRPVVKQIDTLAAEYPAQTNYLYFTYNGSENDVEAGTDQPYIVLGSGAYRIGSSVEFDWCCVNATRTLSGLGHRTVMLNCNPETVSTDYDVCDRLYFDELSLERVLDVCDHEDPRGVLLSMGGQIPNNLAVPLGEARAPIVGTRVEDIDRAENRKTFSALLDEIGVDQPPWAESTSLPEALSFAREVEYPVLIRPSYVLSGAAMSVAHSDDELKVFLEAAAEVSKEHPVVISKFILNAKEIELDGVAQQGRMIGFAISEHVENAGVHSGDATLVFPAQKLYLETIRRVKRIARSIAQALRITGPFNIQFLAKKNAIRVIECNLRASRSFPFVSKVLRENLIALATRAMISEEPVPEIARSAFELDYVGVKAPQFSFSRLKGADPLLGVEMASTGEVGCLGDDVYEAFLKALLAVGIRMPSRGVLLSTGTIKGKVSFLDGARRLERLGLPLFATAGTHRFLKAHGVESTLLRWPHDDSGLTVLDAIETGLVDLVINVPKSFEKEELTNGYLIRRKAVDFGVGLLTNIQAAGLFVDALERFETPSALPCEPWTHYK